MSCYRFFSNNLAQSAAFSIVLLLTLLVPCFSQESRFERDTNRPGSDFRNFDLSDDAGAGACFRACQSTGDCRAWTYVKANHGQGPHPRCWLKNSVPEGVPNDCCTSGVVHEDDRYERDTNRPGSDFKNFDLPDDAGAGACFRACERDGDCRAWTYVKANHGQGPRPRCWLKNSVPGDVPNDCCTSGVIRDR